MDFEKDIDITATDEQLRWVSILAHSQLEWEKKIAYLTKELEAAIEALRDVQGFKLPELMKEIGLLSITLKTGEKVEIKHVIKASIKEENKPKAFAWLRRNGHGSLIKDEVITRFGMGEEKQAKSLLAELIKRGLSTSEKESVHVQTLSAFVHEQMENGRKIPMDLLGVFEYNEARIK